MEAPLPPFEQLRLQTLHNLGILDSEGSEDFDAIVDLAAAICDTPIALISLVDEDRQWFLARRGLDDTETPRSASFCAHAMLGHGVMEVQNAPEDARFEDNILVTGEPGIQFYAGAPLNVAGQPMGTVCVIDRKPRDLDPHQLHMLTHLAKLARRLIQIQQRERQETVSGLINIYARELAAPINPALLAASKLRAELQKVAPNLIPAVEDVETGLTRLRDLLDASATNLQNAA